MADRMNEQGNVAGYPTTPFERAQAQANNRKQPNQRGL